MTCINTWQKVIGLGCDCIQSFIVYTVAQGPVLLMHQHSVGYPFTSYPRLNYAIVLHFLHIVIN